MVTQRVQEGKFLVYNKLLKIFSIYRLLAKNSQNRSHHYPRNRIPPSTIDNYANRALESHALPRKQVIDPDSQAARLYSFHESIARQARRLITLAQYKTHDISLVPRIIKKKKEKGMGAKIAKQATASTCKGKGRQRNKADKRTVDKSSEASLGGLGAWPP